MWLWSNYSCSPTARESHQLKVFSLDLMLVWSSVGVLGGFYILSVVMSSGHIQLLPAINLGEGPLWQPEPQPWLACIVMITNCPTSQAKLLSHRFCPKDGLLTDTFTLRAVSVYNYLSSHWLGCVDVSLKNRKYKYTPGSSHGKSGQPVFPQLTCAFHTHSQLLNHTWTDWKSWNWHIIQEPHRGLFL